MYQSPSFSIMVDFNILNQAQLYTRNKISNLNFYPTNHTAALTSYALIHTQSHLYSGLYLPGEKRPNRMADSNVSLRELQNQAYKLLHLRSRQLR